MVPEKQRVIKRIDRMIGRWFCGITGKVRVCATARRPRITSPQPAPPVPRESVRHMLIIRPGGLGDAVLTFPMIRALKIYYPDALIDVLAETRNVTVYRINPIINATFTYDRKPVTTLCRLRRLGYDLVIDTEQFHHLSALVALGLRPRYFCGFATLGRGRLQTHAVAYSDHVYEAQSFLALVEALAGHPIGFDPNKPFVDIPEGMRSWAKAKLALLDNQAVATISPGASCAYRLWPSEHYSTVARWLAARGFSLVVLGGEDAAEYGSALASGLARNEVLNLAGRTTIAQTAALVHQGQLHISADSGVLHLAYGVGTKTVGLFGPGNYEKWAPPVRQHVTVRQALPCSPCTRMGQTPKCPHQIACMASIKVDDVINAIEKVLAL